MLASLFIGAAATYPRLDLSCLTSSWPPARLAGLYMFPFTGGEDGISIVDGGSDMFDTGNELRVRSFGQWTPPLRYTQVCSGERSEPAGAYTHYATCKTQGPAPLFAAVFHSDGAAIDGFRVGGDLGADGTGNLFANPGTRPLVAANTTNGHVYGYFKKVFGSSTDPSVNHLILARAPTADTTVGTSTNDDLHEVRFTRGVHELYYLLFAGSRGHEFAEADFQAVLEAATKCLPPVLPLPHSPPPPHAASAACSKSCGTGTCQRFEGTSCGALAAVLPGCDCTGCCLDTPFMPQHIPPPPPEAVFAPPPPAACNAPCAGSTCGAFHGTTCEAFKGSLGCDCTGCCKGSHSLACVTTKWPADLPNLYAFGEGYSGRTIADGGKDMYDNGNVLSLQLNGKWQMELPYTQDCDGLFPSSLFGGLGEYSTCKLMDGTLASDTRGEKTAGTLFAAAFSSTASAITGFAVTGNLGADGEGHQVYFNVTGPRGVRGYYKQVYGAQNDPSINHLILARSHITQHIPDVTTDSDWQELFFTKGQPEIYYLLWAGKEPSVVPGLESFATSYRYTRAEVQKLVDAVANSCFDGADDGPPASPPEPRPPRPRLLQE